VNFSIGYFYYEIKSERERITRLAHATNCTERMFIFCNEIDCHSFRKQIALVPVNDGAFGPGLKPRPIVKIGKNKKKIKNKKIIEKGIFVQFFFLRERERERERAIVYMCKCTFFGLLQ
jgi:hypothetical protein